MLRREPGQEGRRCLALAFPPGWTQPGAGSAGLYPSPRLLRVCTDSPRGCPSLPTLISVSRVGKENQEVGDALGASAVLGSPCPALGAGEGLGQGCFPPWTTTGLWQGWPGCTLSPCGDLGL